MKQSNNTNTTEQTLIVMRDNELDMEYMPVEPTIAQKAIQAAEQAISSGVAKVSGYVLKQARMAVYDVLHGTHYRKIHNQLQRELREDRYLRRTGVYDLIRQTSHLAK